MDCESERRMRLGIAIRVTDASRFSQVQLTWKQDLLRDFILPKKFYESSWEQLTEVGF
jgi:hypothetical protein